ncbi:MAG: acyl-CoA thioesterase [Gemmatimonadetes bacterium GWC2_71_10]|nr:MAG: acyl-CoA thioesterase [Gemmatimonadetes bacterium GWC2_71_10]
MEGKAPRLSHTTMAELMMPHMANVLGNVHGGVLLGMMDRVAAVSAIRHAQVPCVTVSVDRVHFREPIHVGELVTMYASVNYAHRTSIEVGIRVEAEDVLTGARRHTNSCYLTYVAIDQAGRPVAVRPVVPETDEERARYKAAEVRRAQRIAERTAKGV